MPDAQEAHLAALEEALCRTCAAEADLEGERAAIEESTTAGPDDEHDAEGSTVGYERSRVSALIGAARTRLDQLEEAISRTRAGMRSRCERCDKPISPERLAVLPATTCCVACASAGRSLHQGRPAAARPVLAARRRG